MRLLPLKQVITCTAFLPVFAALSLSASLAWGASIVTYIPGDPNPPNPNDPGNYTIPYAINESGVVAAVTSQERLATYSAGVLRVATSSPIRPTAFLGINSSGQITGSAFPTLTSNLRRPFLYTGVPGSGGSAVLLPSLGGDDAAGRGINDQGDIAGWSFTAPGQQTFHAFKYTGTPGAGGQIKDLGTLVAGGNSYGTAISNAGQITGYASVAGGANHAMLYTGTPGVNGVMLDLGTLGGNSLGAAINSTGQIVGISNFGTSTERPFRYSGVPGQGGSMVALPLPNGFLSAEALGINDAGFAVGGGLGGNFSSALLWLPDNTPLDLNAWLDTVDPAEGAKWNLDTAYDINNSRQITGIGYYDDGAGGLPDGPAGWVLDASALVPEPGTAVLLGNTMPLALLRLRQSRASRRRHTRFFLSMSTS